MWNKALHHNWSRVLMGVFGTALMAVGTNIFIVPQGLYSGGLYGLCQVIRTLLSTVGGITVTQVDLAGILYLLLNLPLFWVGIRTMGYSFMVKTIICTISNSLFLTLIPIPATPIITDILTSCLLAGIIGGFGFGLLLTCGCSTGGMDIIGLYLSKKGGGFTVGKISMAFNVLLYMMYLFLFNASTAIYSAISSVFGSLFTDKFHQQNITVQVLIFSKQQGSELAQFIMQKLGRGITYWEGRGAYTDEGLRVLCVCLSKYEIDELEDHVHEIDPGAFFIIQEGVRVEGAFDRNLT